MSFGAALRRPGRADRAAVVQRISAELEHHLDGEDIVVLPGQLAGRRRHRLTAWLRFPGR